jgi:hypothetical protein
MSIAIFSVFSLACLWLAYWLYQRYAVDCLRQRLFEQRDRLFLFAMEGGVPFDHDAYRLLRRQMNGLIRFAHRIRLELVLAHKVRESIFGRAKLPDVSEFEAEFERAVGSLPRATQEALRGYRMAALILIAVHLARTSVLVFTSALLWVLFTKLRSLRTPVIQLCKNIENRTSRLLRHTIDPSAMGAA